MRMMLLAITKVSTAVPTVEREVATNDLMATSDLMATTTAVEDVADECQKANFRAVAICVRTGAIISNYAQMKIIKKLTVKI